MLASPLSPSMPSLEPVVLPAPILPPVSAHATSAEGLPELELQDEAIDVDADEEDDDDEDDDDDSSDDKPTTDVNLLDDTEEAADGQPDPHAAADEGGVEGEGEEANEDDEEPIEPCPRFYIRIKEFGPYVNYSSLLKHAQPKHSLPPTNPASNPQLQPAAVPPVNPPSTPAGVTAAAADAPTAANVVGGPATAADDESDVQIVGEGRIRRKRQSTQDEYDTSDPFIDDTELPQEREEDDMRTEIEGFHVQIGAVQVREREVAVKSESSGAADEPRKKRHMWTKRQIPMSAAMSTQLDKIVKECQLLGGSDALGGSHRRLPDELVELLVQLNAIFEVDSAAWDGTERKVLRHNMFERLEVVMGQTRQALRSRMKTAVQRHKRDQLDQQIRSHKQSLQKAAAHDYSDFHHRISTAPQPTTTKGNVVVHRSADGRIERYEYRPRFSLWMDELLALAAAVVEAAGVRRGDDGRAVESEGWKVEKDLWDEAAGWWGAGVMTGKLIAERVKQARKDRRKKKAQQKQPTANTHAAPSHISQAAGKPTAPAADKQPKHKEKEKEKGSEKEKRKRDSGTATEKEKQNKRARTEASKDTAKSGKAADSASHKHKAASAKPQKESRKEKDSSHKRSASATPATTAASSAASTASAGRQPLRSAVFYEPPAGASRWSNVHFPPAAVTAKQSAPNKPNTSLTPGHSQLTQTQR